MKVVIDTLAHERGGGITYLKNVLPRLNETDAIYKVLVPPERDELDQSQPDNIELVEVTFPVGNIILRLIYQQFILPFVLLSLDTDVLYSPADITTILAPCPTVVAVRNPNPYFDQPNRTTVERVHYRIQRTLTRISVWRSNTVIFVSEYSQNRMNQFLNIDEEQCHVVYHGIDPTPFKNPTRPNNTLRSTIAKHEPYVLCVSTIYRHKNYEALIRGYANLSDKIRDTYSLLIAGGYTDKKYFESIRNLARNEGVEDRVHFLGRIEYKFVPFLYRNASASVLPSKLETFGHPLVESMAAGTPLVAADSTCIPEITGDAALLFDPDDPKELSNHLEKVLTDESVSQQLTSIGNERVKRFTWDRTAQETHELLRMAAKT